MKGVEVINIKYQYKSANGADITKTISCLTASEAESFCKKIDIVGYKILDVTRETKFGGGFLQHAD